jgi:hypothetical protein
MRPLSWLSHLLWRSRDTIQSMNQTHLRRFRRQRQATRELFYRPRSFVLAYVIMLLLGVMGAVGVYLGFTNLIPEAREKKLETAKTSLTVVAGCGAGAALYIGYRKQRNEEGNSTREHDRLFTDRYTMASEQLGHESAAVRLAGMYALARIADDSERDRSTCLSVICGYLRMPFDPEPAVGDPMERNVRITAQKILEDRLRPSHPHFWRDANVDLSGATLIHAAFAGAILRKAHFTGARFYDYSIFGQTHFAWRTWFDDAEFLGDVWFGYTIFDEQTSFENTRFYASVGFDEARFNHPVTRFDGVQFASEASFQGVHFSRDVPFEGFHAADQSQVVWPTNASMQDGVLRIGGS